MKTKAYLLLYETADGDLKAQVSRSEEYQKFAMKNMQRKCDRFPEHFPPRVIDIIEIEYTDPMDTEQ